MFAGVPEEIRRREVPRLFPLSEFEEVYEVLRRDGGEAAVRIVGRAGMSRVLKRKKENG